MQRIKMGKLIKFALIILAFVLVVYIAEVYAVPLARYNLLLSREIELTQGEAEMFFEYFEMQQPEYLHVLNCTSGSNDDMKWFGLKAVVSEKDAEMLTEYLDNEENFETMYVHRHDDCIGSSLMIDHCFADNIEWWRLDTDKQTAHFVLMNEEEYRYSAIVIEKDHGMYYVYMWHEDPAGLYH